MYLILIAFLTACSPSLVTTAESSVDVEQADIPADLSPEVEALTERVHALEQLLAATAVDTQECRLELDATQADVNALEDLGANLASRLSELEGAVSTLWPAVEWTQASIRECGCDE